MNNMKKFSVGTDIIEIKRIAKSCENKRFIERVYSKKELSFFSKKKNPFESYAGNWAAKESFGKALGTGVRDFELTNVSCLRDEMGCPYLELTGNALEIASKNNLDFSVSISHTKEYATAVVIAFEK